MQRSAIEAAPAPKRQANKKRRRSSKKLPAIDSATDPSVLLIDWTQVADLLSVELQKKTKQQEQQLQQQLLLKKCSKLSRKRKFYKR